MTLIRTIFALLLLTTIVACSSTKTKEDSTKTSTVTTTTTTTSTTTNDSKMINEGFSMGTIVFSDKADDCAYTIQVEGKEGLMYDPVNLDVKYQKHNEKIWFTFNPLRRMNRCVKANPIQISDIKKRS